MREKLLPKRRAVAAVAGLGAASTFADLAVAGWVVDFDKVSDFLLTAI